MRAGDSRAFDAYEAHGRIIPGTLEAHLARMADTWITNHHHGAATALVASTNDHVDTINRAIQEARLDAGHLVPDMTTRIAGGEHAHVGDVVATRRNDRRLITAGGEPVRNRDTWTVTAIGDDGSLTVSHHGGHGDVTLPVDYTREQCPARLRGDRARRESGNVTAGISMVSSATTVRGVYVAVTRGSDENVICVITDSNDIAEARDVLEGIVAIDRADVPAVTQRRSLAHQSRDYRRTRSPHHRLHDARSRTGSRPLLHDARNALAVAEQRAAAQAVQRQRLLDALAAADNALDAVAAAATAPNRDADAHAVAASADEARRHLAGVQRRLDTAPRRVRPSLRDDLDVAERRLERADAYLERTRQRTEPSIERYRLAQAHRHRGRDNLPHRYATDLLDAMQHPVAVHRQRVAALDTWQQWAKGDDVGTNDLRGAVDTLNSVDGTSPSVRRGARRQPSAVGDAQPRPTSFRTRDLHMPSTQRASRSSWLTNLRPTPRHADR